MAGELVIREDGYVGLEDSNNAAADKGAWQVFTDKPEECLCCCDECNDAPPHPPGKTIHFINVPPNGTGPYDLTPYRYRGECFRLWWLWTIIGKNPPVQFDANGCFTGGTNILHASGTIVDGELVGLPLTWRPPSYSYDGPTYLVAACCG